MNDENNEKEKELASSDPEAYIAAPFNAEEAESKNEAPDSEQRPYNGEEIKLGKVSEKVKKKSFVDEAVQSNEPTTAEDKMEVDSVKPVASSSNKPTTSSNTPVDELVSRLAEVVKSVPGTTTDVESALQASSQTNTNACTLSTENLLSVLEGSSEKETSSQVNKETLNSRLADKETLTLADKTMPIRADKTMPTPTNKATPCPVIRKTPSTADKKTPRLIDEAVPATSSQPESQEPSVKPPPKSNKKYIYKLKSKTGKVLKYISNVPIVLKKPVITLTKMPVEEEEEEEEEETKDVVPKKRSRVETDDVDSDNSTKENNVKENDASRGTLQRIARKRGRPPLSQKAPVVTLDDQYSSDATDSKEAFKNSSSSSSFGMQTRKRQLKFLPDGRLVTPGKKFKGAAATSSASKVHDESSSSDSDIISASDEDSQSDRKAKKSSAIVAKKFEPTERGVADKRGKPKKVFDYESYFREKTTGSPASESKAEKQLSTSAKAIAEIQKSHSVQLGNSKHASGTTATRTPTPGNNTSSSLTTPPSSAQKTIDPAQLLSSLIGVPILPSQLNLVKFKPKVIQDRKTMSGQKNVTYIDSTPKKSGGGVMDVPHNAPYKMNSKPSLQRILPKPSSSTNKTPTFARRTLESSKVVTSSPLITLTTMPPNINSAMKPPASVPTRHHLLSPAKETPKFDSYTDSRVVKTREGPKKLFKQKEQHQPNECAGGDGDDDDEIKTIYDLVQNVFDQIPSWNLHIIPDTNSFCIAQVSRGRMGIPILKKSIELNAEFAAKVYVHQLHCKRYDGVYDTESKILSLIREIDALAA